MSSTGIETVRENLRADWPHQSKLYAVGDLMVVPHGERWVLTYIHDVQQPDVFTRAGDLCFRVPPLSGAVVRRKEVADEILAHIGETFDSLEAAAEVLGPLRKARSNRPPMA